MRAVAMRVRHLLIVLVLCGAPGTRGQPATRPAAGASRPSTLAATGPSTMPVKISLNFKDAPLDTVLNYLSEQAGFVIIKDGPVDGRVTILSKQPVSAEEAITLVNASLKVNGFTAVRDGRVLRISPRDRAKKGDIPVHFGSNPDEIANTDELITQVIPVQNVPAPKLRDDLKPMISTDADVAANEGSNTIVITDASSAIRRVVKIIAELDQHAAATSEIRSFPLRYANAAQAVKLLDQFFKAQGGGPQQPQPGMPIQMMQGGQQPGGAGAAKGDRHGQNVVSAADERTNTVVVMGTPATLKMVEDLLKKLDSDPAPATEMKSFSLKYAEADATAKLINNLAKPAKGDNDNYPFYYFRMRSDDEKKQDFKVNAVSDDRTNTLIVTGSAEAIKNVEELIKMLDANPMASADLRIFQLKYADAYVVGKQIEDMFKSKDDGSSRFPFYYFFGTEAPPQGKQVKVNVSSDDRTNSLMVTAPTELLKVIEKVVEHLDSIPATEDTMFIYHLRNAQASSLEYVLNVLFGNIESPQQNQGPNAQGQQVNQQQQNQNRLGAQTSSLTDNGPNRNTSINRQRNRNRPGIPRVSGAIQKAVNELTGRVFVVADLDTNSLLVTTAAKYQKSVQQIIDDLDRPVPQVLIKVLVAEVTHDNSADLGLDFSVLNMRPSGQGQKGGTNFGNALQTQGLVVSVLEANLAATLHALAVEDKLDVLSRPYLLTSDNQLANILIGSQVPLITNSNFTDFGQQINTIKYTDIGLSLNVTPHINPDGMVILDVAPEISQLTAETVPISSTTVAPVISVRRADSRIGVMDGQTVVIGGLMEDRNTSTINKVPILGDIPVLNLLLNRTQTKKTKTELLIFLTPHVARKPEVLAPMSRDEEEGTRLTPNAVAPGTFDEHMRGMRRGEDPQTQPAESLSPINSINLSEPQDKASGRLESLTPSTGPSTRPPGER